MHTRSLSLYLNHILETVSFSIFLTMTLSLNVDDLADFASEMNHLFKLLL